ncbi:MAG: tetratricopeptide repeat protein [Steroidobacteraceae bacterium]
MRATPTAVPVLLAVALLGVIASVSACGGADASRASHIARGQKYLADGRLEKARVEFADALQIAPQNPQAHFLLGRVTERLGDPRSAAGLYQGAIDLDPQYIAARASLARLYLFTRTPAKALALIQPALARQADDPELLTIRSVARLRLKDAAGALADAERAVSLAPASVDAVSTLADVYRESGQPQRAVELLRTTIAREPQAIPLHQILAGMYVAGGDYPPAEEQLLQIVQLRPAELTPRLQLARFYLDLKRLDDAERTLKDATTALPKLAQARLAYAEFLAAHRSPAQGEAVLRQLIAEDPLNYDLQLRLGDLLQRGGASGQAVATYRAVIAQDPNGPKGCAARDRLAALDEVGGRYADAKGLLAETLRVNPRDNDALILRANIALEERDPLAAIGDLRAVLRDQPAAVPVLRTLARAHLQNNDPTLAEESLRSALAVAPGDLGVRLDLGGLLTRTHRADEAIALLEETVRQQPDIPGTPARKALIEAYLTKPDLPAARAAAENLKSLSPAAPLGWYLAGIVAQQQGRLDDAQHQLQHALQLQPAADDVLAALARLQFAHGQQAQAVALVQGAIERSPGDAVARDLLGELYLAQQNRTGQAIAVLSEAVRLAPGWWLPYRDLARAKLAAKDTAGALAVYEAGVRASGEPALVVELAETYVRQGRVDDAIRQYETLHERSPGLQLAANNLAMLLATYRKDRASLDRARDLSAAFADSPVGALLDTHGWVMLKSGEVPAALADLQRAYQEAPDSKVILYHLGIAQLQAGQPDKARTSLEAALAGGASFSGTQDARLALASLKGRRG